MNEKKGLLKLGFVKNLKSSENGPDCMSFLSRLVGRPVSSDEIDEFIESDNFNQEFIDKDGNVVDKNSSIGFRFKLPWQDVDGNCIYGHFTKKDSKFIGVLFGDEKIEKSINLKKYGHVDPACWDKLKSFSGKFITEKNIKDYIITDPEYYNGAGYKVFPDGKVVTSETGKFIKFSTEIQAKEGSVVGWFTKIKGRYEGISWGTEEDFKSAQKLREQFYVGRMIFDSIDDCNDFLERLKKKTIEEPWEYKCKKEEKFKYPILKSYLEYELDRLFYEQEVLKYLNRIILNDKKDKVLFNTNLIDMFGHDLTIVGTLQVIQHKSYISDLEISPSTMKKKNMGFDSSKEPMPPEFFQDINEIIFHGNWEIDKDMEKYEHIIEERKERFPEKYRKSSAYELGVKLDHAIDFAKIIAQRNYKFIVPMYYPSKKRIQLLMPIYLETSYKSYTSHPDFALVLTPHNKEKIYTPETILGLDEVYQDARLIATPEESWLRPELIE